MGLRPVVLPHRLRPVPRAHRRQADPHPRPGEHFGELAARDWGGGYGYTRLATVVCAEPGQLLRLSSDDFRGVVDTEPTAKAQIARDLADRLEER